MVKCQMVPYDLLTCCLLSHQTVLFCKLNVGFCHAGERSQDQEDLQQEQGVQEAHPNVYDLFLLCSSLLWTMSL
jgi:hypothetical protein